MHSARRQVVLLQYRGDQPNFRAPLELLSRPWVGLDFEREFRLGFGVTGSRIHLPNERRCPVKNMLTASWFGSP